MSSLDQIREAWENGKFILLFDSDSREGEVDMVIPSEMVDPQHISILRNDAGGLICTALSHEVTELLELPYISDVYEMGNSQLNKMLNR